MTSHMPLLNRIHAAKTPPEAKSPFALPEGDWQGGLYPRRVPPLTRNERNLFQRLFLAIIRRSSGDPYDYNCFLVTARLGRLFPIHTLLVSELLRGGKISPPDTERIVIHVASRLGCQYEYAHHTRMALEHGISRNEIESLTNDDDPIWSARTRTLLTAADELLESKNLSPTTHRGLRGELNDDQIIEFCMIVGHYVMAAMMLNVAGCEIESPYALTG